VWKQEQEQREQAVWKQVQDYLFVLWLSGHHDIPGEVDQTADPGPASASPYRSRSGRSDQIAVFAPE
jgi:hypothetical protein